MLQVVLPLARVLFRARHAKSSLTFFLTIYEVADIFAAINPHFFALTLHNSVNKLSEVGFLLVLKVVLTKTVKDTFLEIAFIVASICPVESSFAILFVISKRANKSTSIRCPGLNSGAV